MMDFAEYFCNELENIFIRKSYWDTYIQKSLIDVVAGKLPQLKSFLLGNKVTLDAKTLNLTEEGLHALPESIRIMHGIYISIRYEAESASVKVQLAQRPTPSSENSLVEKYGYGARLYGGIEAYQALLDSEAYPGNIAFDWKNNCAYLSEHAAMHAEFLFLKEQFVTDEYGEDLIARKFFCVCARHDARQAFHTFRDLYSRSPKDFGFTVHTYLFKEYNVFRDPPPFSHHSVFTHPYFSQKTDPWTEMYQRVFCPYSVGIVTRWDRLSSYLQNRKGAKIREPLDCVIKFFRYYLGERWFES